MKWGRIFFIVSLSPFFLKNTSNFDMKVNKSHQNEKFAKKMWRITFKKNDYEFSVCHFIGWKRRICRLRLSDYKFNFILHFLPFLAHTWFNYKYFVVVYCVKREKSPANNIRCVDKGQSIKMFLLRNVIFLYFLIFSM